MSRRSFWLAMVLLCGPVAAQSGGLSARAPRLAGAVDEAALARFKSLPPPVQSSDGTVYVGCVSAERAALRWPVLRFADSVRRNFAEVFLPLSSLSSPLSIELGAETNRVTTLTRRMLRTADGFSQLIIRVPNPETVDLDALRVAIVEAQLRERARALGGSYAALKWPAWFVEAAVDVSRGNVWKAEAYETVHTALADGAVPNPDAFFDPATKPSREVAAFFAQWVFSRRGGKTVARREELITAAWTREAILGDATDKQWVAWLSGQEDTVFVPGVLTRAQFVRWAGTLDEPGDDRDALRLANRLSRFAVGRPQAFRDLTELYLRAYAAFATGDAGGYGTFRAEADDARKLLEAHLLRVGSLADNPLPVTSLSIKDSE